MFYTLLVVKQVSSFELSGGQKHCRSHDNSFAVVLVPLRLALVTQFAVRWLGRARVIVGSRPIGAVGAKVPSIMRDTFTLTIFRSHAEVSFPKLETYISNG